MKLFRKNLKDVVIDNIVRIQSRSADRIEVSDPNSEILTITVFAGFTKYIIKMEKGKVLNPCGIEP